MVRPRAENSFLADWSRMWEPDLGAIAFNGATCDPTRVHPKVLDWVRESCGEHPHFVKVINRNAAHGQPGLIAQSSACLVVPGPFVRENFRKLQRVVTLDNGRGRKWKVSFKSVASRAPVWLRGWRIVARDNNLKPGDVMVLELVGVSHFRITVFDEEGEISPGSTSGLRNAGREFKRGESTSKSSKPMRRAKLEYFSSDSDTQEDHFKEIPQPFDDQPCDHLHS